MAGPFEDTFVGTEGADISSRTPTGTNPGTSWAAIVDLDFPNVIVLNAANQAEDGSDLSSNRYKMTDDLGFDEMDVQADFTEVQALGRSGLIFRVNDATDTAWEAGYDHENQQWYITDGIDVVSNFGAWPGNPTTLKVECRTGVTRLYGNGILQATFVANTLAGNRKAGITLLNFSSSGVTARVDNYSAVGVATIIPIAASDTLPAGFGDATFRVRALVATTETTPLALTDASLKVQPGVNATETLAVQVAEVLTNIFVRVPVTDPLAVTLNDPSPALFVVLSAIETLPVALQDAIFLRATVLTAETFGVVLSDVGAFTIASPIAFITASDGLAVGLTDVNLRVRALIASPDTLPIALTDAVATLATGRISATDTFAVVLNSSFPDIAQIVASDTARVALTDAGIASILGPSVIKLAADTFAANLSDLVGAVDRLARNEEISFAVTELASRVATIITTTDAFRVITAELTPTIIVSGLDIVASDALALSLVDDLLTMRVRFESTDTLPANLVDVMLALRAVATAADTFGVTLVDAGAILVANLASILATDTTAVQAIELAAVITVTMLAISASETAAVTLDDLGATPAVLSDVRTASDSLPRIIDEYFPTLVAGLIAPVDGLAVALAEFAQRVIENGDDVPILGSDPMVLVLGDSAIATIIGTLLDIEADDTFAVASGEQAFRIMAGIAADFPDAVEIAAFDVGEFRVILNLLNNILVATVTLVAGDATADDVLGSGRRTAERVNA